MPRWPQKQNDSEIICGRIGEKNCDVLQNIEENMLQLYNSKDVSLARTSEGYKKELMS